MRKGMYITFIVSALGLSSFSMNSFAGNTMVFGAGTRGQTLQAFTAVADDPSAIFYNPAGLTQVKGTEVDAGLLYMHPTQRYKGGYSGTTTHSRVNIFAPNLFLSSDSLSQVTVGLGLYAPFARKTDYQRRQPVCSLKHKAQLVRLDLVPTAAYDINRYISIGLGLVGSRLSLKTDILGLKESGHGYGVSGQGGVLFKLPAKVKAGLSYLGPMKVHVNGSGTGSGIHDHYDMDAKFPGVVNLGLAWQAADPLLFSVDYDYEMWSSVNRMRREYDDPTLNAMANSTVDGKNVGNIRVGVLYKPKVQDELRLGYGYLPASVPKHNIIPATPDYDTHVMTVGYSHTFENMRMDMGYEHALTSVMHSKAPFLPGKYSAHENSVLLGFAYNFG